jgi:predicted nucleotidyltransferase
MPTGADPAAPDQDYLPEVLTVVHQALEEANIPYGLIGGVASSVHGRPRTTRDVDVFLRPGSADPALDVLAARGFRVERTDPKWIFKAFKHEVQVDVIFSTGRGIYFDDEMSEHSRIAEFRGVTVRVIAPEDLVMIKAIAHDEATPRHWHDALGVVMRARIDWDYLLERARYGQRRLLSLLLYAQSLDYAVPDRVIQELMQRIAAT